MAESFYELAATANGGKDVSMDAYRGKVVLVVNTASKCGFTPQYKGLQALHEKYKDRGLVLLGFPCDQFAHQEPGTNEEIAAFCERNFGVTFPLMAKVDVNGKDTHPVFEFLKERAPAGLGKAVKWNFTKFLVQKDGKTVKRYPPNAEPESLEGDLEAALSS